MQKHVRTLFCLQDVITSWFCSVINKLLSAFRDIYGDDLITEFTITPERFCMLNQYIHVKMYHAVSKAALPDDIEDDTFDYDRCVRVDSYEDLQNIKTIKDHKYILYDDKSMNIMIVQKD